MLHDLLGQNQLRFYDSDSRDRSFLSSMLCQQHEVIFKQVRFPCLLVYSKLIQSQSFAHKQCSRFTRDSLKRRNLDFGALLIILVLDRQNEGIFILLTNSTDRCEVPETRRATMESHENWRCPMGLGTSLREYF